ncbi:tRNA 2-thiocytidine(32) synthetase TtcA, partial [Xylella fastidiosa]|nr:tRNA 2-thiocytidine(32) synthetase TtcA [Xylella fastidiosa]
MGNIRPSQLADQSLFDFLALGRHSNTPLPNAHAWLAGDRRQRHGSIERLFPFPFPSGHAMFFRNLTLFRFPTSLDFSQIDSILPNAR